MVSLTVIILLGAFSVLSITNADRITIEPKLEFRDVEGSHFVPILQHENLDEYVNFRAFMAKTTEVCSIGVWAFYPETEFLFKGINGASIENDEGFHCYLLTDGERNSLLSMKSYRHIGPEQDLSVKSITLYSEPSFGGRYLFVPEGDQKLLNIPSIFPVKSYIITAPTHDSKTENEAEEHIPLIRLFQTLDLEPVGPKTCLALINHRNYPPQTLAKMHLQDALVPTDYFGSLEFILYRDDAIISGGPCDYTNYNFVELPSRSRLVKIIGVYNSNGTNHV